MSKKSPALFQNLLLKSHKPKFRITVEVYGSSVRPLKLFNRLCVSLNILIHPRCLEMINYFFYISGCRRMQSFSPVISPVMTTNHRCSDPRSYNKLWVHLVVIFTSKILHNETHYLR